MPEIKFDAAARGAYRAAFAPAGTTDVQFELLITECERRGLIPGQHVVFQLRSSREYNAALKTSVDVIKPTLITTINALRLIAERSGKFEGYGRFTYYYGDADGNPSIKSEIPLGKIPHAVGIELYRQGWKQSVFAVARYDAYCQTKKDGNKDVPTTMWRLRGEEQLAKCAEALGLRMVAPEECGGLYIAEEFDRENKDAAAAETATAPAAAEIPQPTVAPAVNQAAAPIVAETAAPAPAPAAAAAAAPPPKPAPRPVPAARKPAPPAVPQPAPAAAKPVAAPAAPAVHNRVPNVDGPTEESPEEIAQLADAIARDPDPADEPAVVNPTSAAPVTPAATAVAVPAETVAAPTANFTASAPIAEQTQQPAPAVTAPTAAQPADAPATATEYQTFLNRAAKVSRDKLEAVAKLKGAGQLLKAYLEKKAGKPLKKMTAMQWEEILHVLEQADAETAAKLVKENA